MCIIVYIIYIDQSGIPDGTVDFKVKKRPLHCSSAAGRRGSEQARRATRQLGCGRTTTTEPAREVRTSSCPPP